MQNRYDRYECGGVLVQDTWIRVGDELRYGPRDKEGGVVTQIQAVYWHERCIRIKLTLQYGMWGGSNVTLDVAIPIFASCSRTT
jgi:hypothetical protein